MIIVLCCAIILWRNLDGEIKGVFHFAFIQVSSIQSPTFFAENILIDHVDNDIKYFPLVNRQAVKATYSDDSISNLSGFLLVRYRIFQ